MESQNRKQSIELTYLKPVKNDLVVSNNGRTVGIEAKQEFEQTFKKPEQEANDLSSLQIIIPLEFPFV